MEPISAAFTTFGVVLLLASWIQLLFTSFEDDYTWGLTALFVPPLAYLYGFFSWDKAKASIWMAVIGWVFILFA
ncbi:hypothetical protein [Teredinibacter sp. KSP-S5-2]|uniref:hypothetical protein n=1 Tax=Teredinibacter sp. KSP-S5-2 TaxID=3034506 RepID=UPI002934D437|nr:hypothetical protein [Teredinibacter sp. KSP-S5-2]WNO08752.1 hypothetical protein P5V12_17415 [Teredinibacter sp. KSP-S5-2]